MTRAFPSITTQTRSHSLRNSLCRLTSPRQMAEVSSHLRNFAVAETIGLIGILDSHPQINGRPTIQRGAAVFQQSLGTRTNHFTHVAPSNLLVNGRNMTAFFKTANAQSIIERIFGMGVMAPDNWADLNSFGLNPAQLNIADNIAERFATGDGLVAAFEKTANNASKSGIWDGSARHQHNASSLLDFVVTYYRESWKPGAFSAYQYALGHLSSQLAAAKESGAEAREARIRQRIELIDIQIDVLATNTVNLAEATRNVFSATTEEKWE